jgi:hypothetical protein
MVCVHFKNKRIPRAVFGHEQHKMSEGEDSTRCSDFFLPNVLYCISFLKKLFGINYLYLMTIPVKITSIHCVYRNIHALSRTTINSETGHAMTDFRTLHWSNHLNSSNESPVNEFVIHKPKLIRICRKYYLPPWHHFMH